MREKAKKDCIRHFHSWLFLFRPDFMMEEDIVLVVIQYRLNIFGFMSDESPEFPGNYGMLDQVMALR